MKIRVTMDIGYEPSEFARDYHKGKVVDQFLSDYDMHWIVEEGIISNAKAEVLENA